MEKAYVTVDVLRGFTPVAYKNMKRLMNDTQFKNMVQTHKRHRLNYLVSSDQLEQYSVGQMVIVPYGESEFVGKIHHLDTPEREVKGMIDNQSFEDVKFKEVIGVVA